MNAVEDTLRSHDHDIQLKEILKDQYNPYGKFYKNTPVSSDGLENSLLSIDEKIQLDSPYPVYGESNNSEKKIIGD